MRKLLKVPAVPAVRKAQRGAVQDFVICESIGKFANLTRGHDNGQGMGDWAGGMSGRESTRCLEMGNESLVAESDEYLSQFEDMEFSTQAWRVVSDVQGGVADVPTFLAGHPLSMRRRQKVIVDTAPLVIVADLTSSADITSKDVRRRGCAILALSRMLCAVRPVELWIVVGLGRQGFAGEVLTRIDTTPLDLGRAAHMMGHPSVSRGLGYGYLQAEHQTGGAWNFGDITLHRKTARESYIQALGINGELLYCPPIFSTDKNVTNPVGWIKDMLVKYGGMDIAA